MQKKAVIYCRVSSHKQAKEGHGLDSQETRCREYARYKTLEVVQVFEDEGVSGKLTERPGMRDMLNFIGQQREPYTVIIDDISRLARGLEAHIELRTSIQAAGGILESPSIEFGDDSDSRLVEHLLATVAQHQREKNAEQVVNRMRARLLNGYWVFKEVLGYRYQNVAGHGKMLVPYEPEAAIVKDALEGYASGRFNAMPDVMNFLVAMGIKKLGTNNRIKLDRIKDLLTRVLYTGYIEHRAWNVPFTKAQHAPLISLATFEQIQERLLGRGRVPIVKSSPDDFPLRGFVCCVACNHAMTGTWATGRNGRYGYYFCMRRGCSEYRSNIRKEQVDKDFIELLRQATPSKELLDFVAAVVKDVWEEKIALHYHRLNEIRQQLKTIDHDINKLLDRLINTTNNAIVTSYEGAVEKLQREKLAKEEMLSGSQAISVDFDNAVRTVFSFMSNPLEMWQSNDIEQRKTVLKLVFAKPVQYDKKTGLRTVEYSLPFKMLGCGNMEKIEMVEPGGQSTNHFIDTIITWSDILKPLKKGCQS
jgi:site-specific DNA recombinase